MVLPAVREDEDDLPAGLTAADFVVIEDYNNLTLSGLFGYYPGIVPGYPERSVPLLDLFPELATIDIDVILDVASKDGYLYMTLSGSDGLYLFGARDPSVIPEPSTFALAFLGIFAVLATRRSGSASNL